MTDSRAHALADHLRKTREAALDEQQARVTNSLRALGHLPHARPTVPPSNNVDEGKKTQAGHNPATVQRCVASMLNKGETDSEQDDADISKTDKSKAYAVCWAQQNKGKLTKQFGGATGKTRKDQYKASLKNKTD